MTTRAQIVAATTRRRRRGFSSASQALAALGGACTLWLDEREQTAGTGGISAWGDQGPANNDLAQPGSTQRPDASTVNGIAAPLFVAANTDQEIGPVVSGVITSTAWHVLMVAHVTTHANADTSSAENQAPLIADASGFWGVFSSVGGVQAYVWDGARKTTTRIGVSDGQRYLVEASQAGGVLSCRVGAGAAQTTSGVGAITTLTAVLVLGYRGVAAFDGAVAHAVVCNAAIAPGTLAALRSFLATKYAVAA